MVFYGFKKLTIFFHELQNDYIQHCKTSCRKSDLAHIYCIPSRVNKNTHVFEQDVVCRRAVFVTGQIHFFGGEGQWSGDDPLYYILVQITTV